MNTATHNPDPDAQDDALAALNTSVGVDAFQRSGADLEDAAAWSALVDGELDGPELDALLSQARGSTEMLSTWHSYQVIGDVLRAAVPPVAAKPPADFLAGVRARLPDERPQPVSVVPAPVSATRSREAAANDPVFRWKLVAGLASAAAVMAVSWQALSLGSSPLGGGSQLAAAPPSVVASSAPTRTPVAANSVLVNTQQGVVIRDAHLEELLAEHRQYGGTSALQMPAGFLRNATYDAPAR